MRAALLVLAATAAFAGGCGSNASPPAAAPAAPVRVYLSSPPAGQAWGFSAVAAFVGAERVSDPAAADLVISADPAFAIAAARRRPDAHVLLIAPAPPGTLPENLRVEPVDRGQLAYLAGAVAALAGAHSLRLGPPPDPGLGVAAMAGADAAGGGLVPAQDAPDVTFSGTDVTSSGTRLAVVRPRLDVIVAAAARLVQDGTFRGGVYPVGLREDAVGVTWIAPSFSPRELDRLQHVEDAVRAGAAHIPAVAP